MFEDCQNWKTTFVHRYIIVVERYVNILLYENLRVAFNIVISEIGEFPFYVNFRYY